MKIFLWTVFIGILVIVGYLALETISPLSVREMLIPNLALVPNTATTSAVPSSKPGEVARASFLIYTNGFKRDFSAEMYLNRSPAAYMTAVNPNIIIIEEPYTTWRTFFDSLPFKLSTSCLITGNQQTFCPNDYKELVFYLNGEAITDLFERTIHDGDKLLVSFGDRHEPERLEKEYSSIPDPY